MVSNRPEPRVSRSRAAVAAREPAPALTPGLRLDEIILRLRQIQSAVVVSVAALRHQNCELDEDVAIVLQRAVADRIQDQIEQLEAHLLPSARRQAPSHVN